MEETIDSMMAKLTQLRTEHGGDVRVVISSRRGFHVAEIGLGRAGATTPFKAVSRGGIPVVVISSPSI